MPENTVNTADIIRQALIQHLKWQQELGLEDLYLPDFKPKVTGPADAKSLLNSMQQTHPDIFDGKSATSAKTAAEVQGDPTTVEEHYHQICNCTRCPLHESRHRFVYGDGNPNADLVLIGEAPGADEDRQGRPFVGEAGKLLDKILAAIELSRDDVYICNIIKCRPPRNRDPLPHEIEKCEPYLQKQLELVQPKLICTLGRIAIQTLLKSKKSLSQLRKDVHTYQNIPVVPTYHPAALLRYPKYKRDTWEDMKKLRQMYDDLRGAAV